MNAGSTKALERTAAGEAPSLAISPFFRPQLSLSVVFGRSMKAVLGILVGLLLAACARTPSMHDIRSYGEQRFIDDVLAIADGKQPSTCLLNAFHPLRVEEHLDGAWLVYKDSGGYQEGIYVDRKSLDRWGGSGLEITPWSGKIGWSKEKARR